MKALLLAALAVALVGGCAAPPPEPPQLVPATEPVVVVADPLKVRIPKFNLESDLMALGLNQDHTLQVPPVEHPEQAGWYAGPDVEHDGDETKPGQRGSAVIAAHVDGLFPDGRKGKPGLFADLGALDVGDTVYVDQAGGSSLQFIVESVERFPKSAFPGDRVYGAADTARLNLITCGGAFDSAAGHYEDNIVVFTHLAE